MTGDWLAGLSFCIWIYLLGGRGQFWQVSKVLLKPSRLTSKARIAVVVPARNEADVVGPAIQSLLGQDYSGQTQIVLVDDHSSDDTAIVARRASIDSAGRLAIVSALPLPAGWTGKMWALSQGVQQAERFAPDYFLFTDADIVHASDSISSLVARAEADSLDLVSVMVRLECKSIAEYALIPAFVFFFLMLYPPELVNSPTHKTAGAAGGCMLIRAEALARIGGIAAIRNELIDDCALAREVKHKGRVWLGLSLETRSLRGYDGFRGIFSMISRNAFYQLRHSGWLLVGTVLGMAITFLAPLVLVGFGGRATLLAGAAWLLMSVAFWPTLRLYSRSPLWAPLLPIVAMFYTAATLHSAVQYWLGHGGEWKGRLQDAKSDSAS